jgi:hypothetical protein
VTGAATAEPVPDRAPVAWFAERLRSWQGLPRVGDWIPDGFPRYGRLPHPAYDRKEGHVPWSRVADWSGRELHPTALFEDVATRPDGATWATVGSAPLEGRLPRRIFTRLAAILVGFTTTPEVSWYCVWDGHGGLDDSMAIDVTPRISSSGRRYLLFRVAVQQAAELMIPTTSSLLVAYRPRFLRWLTPAPTVTEPEWYSPNFWWPEDRAWFLSTEVDSRSTYICGSEALLERLDSDPELELLPARWEDPLDGVYEGMPLPED